jgi:hypothetical protein
VFLLALVLWRALARTRWGAAAGWFALALAGHAAALQLISAGRFVALQFFYEWGKLLGTYRVIFLAAVLLQVLIVIWGARKLWPQARPALPRLISWPQALLLLVLFAYTASTIPPELAQTLVAGSGFPIWVVRHLAKVALALLIYGAAAVNLILAVAAVPEEAWHGWKAAWEKFPRSRMAWVAALWVLVVASLLHWFVLDGMPHIPDEVAYIFQAKYISAGNLYLDVPPDVEAFYCRFCMVDDGKWYSAMLGGWPFALALGYLAGAPWLVNPLLGAIGILLSYLLVKRLYDEHVAAATALLLAASPWLLFISASLMPHTLSLVLTLVGLLGVERARAAGHLGWALAAGAGFGALLHVRPLEAVGLAAVAGLWWVSAGWQRLRVAALACTAATGLATTALFLAYNKVLTGNPFLAPVNKFFDQTVYLGANRLGFGADVGNFGWVGLDALPGHGPIDVLMNTNQNLYMVNFELFGWACGSLVFVLLLPVLRGIRRDALLFGLLLGIWAAMSFYWFSGGPDLGARYWYQMILPLAALTVLGARALQESGLPALWHHKSAPVVWAFLVLASLSALLNVIPWRSVDKYKNYRRIGGDFRALQRQHDFGRGLVLVRGDKNTDYGAALVFNPPTLRPEVEGTVYALDLGPESRARLLAFFSERPVWVLEGPSVTRDGYRVVAGPLTMDEAKLLRGP